MYEVASRTPIRVTKSMLGGSLCEIVDTGSMIRKYYRGEISRGHEKLEKEHIWYELIPEQVRKEYPYLFPTSILRTSSDDSSSHSASPVRETDLFVQKFDRKALSKLIIGDVIKPSAAEEWLEVSLRLLTDVVYPLRTRIGEQNLLALYHKPRLELAIDTFRMDEELAVFFEKKPIVVNNNQYSSLFMFIEWLFENEMAIELLNSKQLFSVHGNLHPDNILVSDRDEPSRNGVTFIDPRGDILGPLYYDSAKLMTSAHSRYDEIHYDAFTKRNLRTREYEVVFTLPVDRVYNQLMRVVKTKMIEWAEITGESLEKFTKATLLCQAIHTISLSYYHFKRTNPDINRVEMYLLSACYLGDLARKAVVDNDIANQVYNSRLDFTVPMEKQHG